LAFVAGFFLCIQLSSGLFLAMYYSPDTATAFESVESIVRDVEYGYIVRNVHSVGASFFLGSIYLHIAKNLYYRRYSGETTYV